MAENKKEICISSVKSTVLKLFSMPIPEGSDAPDSFVTGLADKKTGGTVDKAVIYNPDAVAWWVYNKYSKMFDEACQNSDLTLRLRSVMPSVTPVCFASMYSGVMPEIHGIREYAKPVLKVDTLFDDFSKAGKKTAIVSTAGDSISKIFLEREIEYYIYPSIRKVNRKALELIENGTYDLIVIYNGNYDSRMHAKGPESRSALKALEKNLKFYNKMIEKIKKNYSGCNTLYGFCPDHGCHEIDGGRGSHGLEMEEDMNVVHLYGINKKQG